MWCSAVGCIMMLTLSLLAAPLAAEAQSLGKVYRIGYLAAIPPPAHLWEALLDGLRERGESEGRHLVFERRFSEGNSVWHETQVAAGALGLVLYAQDCAGAFAHTAQGHPDGLLVLDDALIAMHRQHIAECATQAHLPSVFAARESVMASGLPHGHIRGQDPERRQTGRSPPGAADERRAGPQPQDCQGAGDHDAPLPAAPGR